MPLVSRPYAGEEAYERLRRMLTEIQPLVGTRSYAGPSDLDWWRWTNSDPEAFRRARLWSTPAGELVGFAWTDDGEADLTVVVHPAHVGLEDEVLAWAEAERLAGDGDGATLQAWAYESDDERRETLRRRGYEPTESVLRRRRRSLADPVEEPRLPAGYELRAVEADDVERRVAVQRAAFPPSQLTADIYRAVMRAPAYWSDLDLVAVAAYCSFAAFCIVWWDGTNRTGVFEPLGTDPAHQRRGLGTAVLREGMRRMRELGGRHAYVGCWGDDGAANTLYDGTGLRAVDDCRAWRRLM